MIRNSDFDAYVEEFKKMSSEKKKEITLEEIKEILAVLTKMKKDLDLPDEILFNKELLNANSKSISDDEFINTIFVYVHSIQESLGSYFEKIQDILYIDNEQE